MLKIPSFFKIKYYNYLPYIVISLFFLVFVLIKASQTSYTHDESYTFNSYVKDLDILSVVFNLKDVTANNHIFLTLVLKFLSIFSFSSNSFLEIWYRLPSIFSFVLFLFSSAVFVEIFFNLKNQYFNFLIKIASYLLLVSNPYLLDFFVLSRGYGMANSFTISSLLSLYFYFKSTNKYKFIFFQQVVLIFSILATYSNFAYLTYTFIFFKIVFLYNLFLFFKNQDKSFYLLSLINVIFTGLFFSSLIILPILNLRNTNKLYFGESDNFWENTINSSIESALYNTNKLGVKIAKYIVLTFFGIGLVNTFLAISRKKIFNNLITIIINYSFLCSALIMTLMFIFLDVKYVVFRAAQFIIIILFLLILSNVSMIIEFFDNQKIKNTISIIFTIIICIPIIYSNFSNLNISYFRDWKYDADTKFILKDLKEKNDSNTSLTIVGSWLLTPTFNFYIKNQYSLNFNYNNFDIPGNPNLRKDLIQEADVVLLFPDQLDSIDILSIEPNSKFNEFKTYENSQIKVFTKQKQE